MIEPWLPYRTKNGSIVNIDFCLGADDPFPMRGVLISDRRKAFSWDINGVCSSPDRGMDIDHKYEHNQTEITK